MRNFSVLILSIHNLNNLVIEYFKRISEIYSDKTQKRSLLKDINVLVYFLFFTGYAFDGPLSQLLFESAIVLAIFVTYLNYKL